VHHQEALVLQQEEKTMKTINLLTAARSLISTPEAWCQGALKTSDGKFCALGAVLEKADLPLFFSLPTDVEVTPTVDALCSAVPNSFKESKETKSSLRELSNQTEPYINWATVAYYNNSHSHEEVLAMFDMAIARQLVIDSMATETELLVEPDEFNKAMKSALLVGV
jgi:hypothetical protein